MDEEDLKLQHVKNDAVQALITEDLAPFSVADLNDRIGFLEDEIIRCRDALKAREKTHAAAEAVFGSKSET